MDITDINLKIAEDTGLTSGQCSSLSDVLTAIISEHLAQKDTIAIPGFGIFAAVQNDEYIATDKQGNRMLMPPSVTVNFTPGTRLKKSTMPAQS